MMSSLHRPQHIRHIITDPSGCCWHAHIEQFEKGFTECTGMMELEATAGEKIKQKAANVQDQALSAKAAQIAAMKPSHQTLI